MKEYRLSDLIEIKHGYAFNGEHIVAEDNGIVLVTPGNFKIGGGFQEEKCKFYIGEIPEEYVLSAGDYIVTMTDLSKTIDTLGYSAIVPKSQNRIYLHNQRIGLIRFISEECDHDYIYYLMQTHEYQRAIANTSTGATVHHTSPLKIKDYKFKAPDIKKQKCIVKILRAYDDLIENNQKQIKLLEEAAQRLYKEWFVDFQFPGYYNTPIVDGLPQGWEKISISKIAKLSAGGDKPKVYSKVKNQLCTIPVYSNGMDDEGLYGYTDKATIIDNCITISARGNVGYACLRRAPFLPIVRLITVIPPSECVEYLYFYFKNMIFKSNGAAQQQITVPMIKDEEVILPSNNLLWLFKEKLSPILDLIYRLKCQNDICKEARDRLLPKLMSGELEV